MSDPIPAPKVFGDWREHACCDCCNGYCLGEDAALDLGLYRVMCRDVTYLTDKIVMVHEEMLTDFGKAIDLSNPLSYPQPETQPPASTKPLRAATVHRLHLLDITVHEGEREQHLYFEGRHVGWIMPIRALSEDAPMTGNTMLLEDLRIISKMALVSHGEWTIDGSGDSWAVAAALLNASRMFMDGGDES